MAMVMRPKAAKAPTVVSSTCTPFSHQRPLSSFQRFSDSSLTTGSRGAGGHHRGSGGGAVPAAGGAQRRQKRGPGAGRAGRGAARRRRRAPGGGSEGGHGRGLVGGRGADTGLAARQGASPTAAPTLQRSATVSWAGETPSPVVPPASLFSGKASLLRAVFPLTPPGEVPQAPTEPAPVDA